MILLIASLATAQSSPCKVGSSAAPTGFWAWAPESRIQVYVLASDFNESELDYLLEPLATWNAVSDATGSKVKFEYKGTTETPLNCRNCVTIKRGHVFGKAKRHLTELRTYSAARDEIMTWAGIVIDPRLTNPKTLTNAVAHELGHSFGLLDCYDCKKNSTVMIKFDAINAANDMHGPSPCDVAQVQRVYQSIATKFKRAKPLKRSVVDEGEEAVDDDTPIVVRKP